MYSGAGPCPRYLLAVIFSDFYRQHSFGFQALRTIMHHFSLTLMSSTSFGDYLILGTQHTNLRQTRRNPRPAGLGQAGWPTPVKIHRATPEHDIKQRPSDRHKNNPLRPKGMYQVHLGPQLVTNHSTKTRTDLRTNVQHVINMTEQQTAEASPS